MRAVLRLTVLVSFIFSGCTSAPPDRPPVDRDDEGSQDRPLTEPAPTTAGESATEGDEEGEGHREKDVPPAAVGDTSGVVEVPLTAAEARALWETRGTAALPLLATFFQMVDLAEGELQGSFELLQEISATIPPGDPASSSVLTATEGFLRLPDDAVLELPVDSTAAPWKQALRFLVGLRFSRELGPLLVDIVQARTKGGLDPERDVIRNAAYGIACLAYLPGGDIVREYARRTRGLESRILAIEMLALLGDPESAPVVRAMIETSDELRLIQPAARTLQVLAGRKAESALADLLRRDTPALQRAALGPLLSICTPSSLRRVVALKDTTGDETTRTTVELHLKRYARQLDLSARDLEELIRSSAEDAVRLMTPYARYLEVLSDDDLRLSREDLFAVLGNWEEAGTLYTPEWSWVRDRHIVSVATPEDEPRFEAVRRAVLRRIRPTSLSEAHIVHRMILAVRRRHRGDD